jgi:hypothetical protein
VTCSRPSAGWIPFNINLTAVSVPDGCGAKGSAMLPGSFDVYQNVNLTRISPAAVVLCSTEPNVTLAYTLSGSVAGAQFNLVPTTTTAALVCTATPSIASELIWDSMVLHGTGWCNKL